MEGFRDRRREGIPKDPRGAQRGQKGISEIIPEKLQKRIYIYTRIVKESYQELKLPDIDPGRPGKPFV